MDAILPVVALVVVLMAGLRGWSQWLAFKHRELELAHPAGAVAPSSGARIELADLKERIRKLEAIAAGVDL